MRIPNYPQITTLGNSDVFLIDGPNGTKIITAENLKNAIAGMIEPSDIPIIEEIAEREFLDHYDLDNSTTEIMETVTGNRIIQNTSTGIITTDFYTDENENDAIRTVIVPNEGEYDYHRTTIIQRLQSGDLITTRYTKVTKE